MSWDFRKRGYWKCGQNLDGLSTKETIPKLGKKKDDIYYTHMLIKGVGY